MAPTDVIEHIKSWPLGKKVSLGAVLVIVIASLILIYVWIQTPDYQILFSNLSRQDAGLVVESLKTLGVPYKNTASGVMVPENRVYDLRLELAAQGLPQGGGVGFEIFDKTGISTSEFVQKINYRRALQGELSRTITSISEISECRVHLTIPERTIFTTDNAKARASVLIRIKQGRKLSQGQVNGIVHLVASSVAGLDTGDVTVVDQNGVVLTSTSDSDVALSGTHFEHQKKIEKDIENRITGILEPVVGAGKVTVSASALVDFTRTEKTEEMYDPDSQVVRSEQRQTEQNVTPAVSGVPGTSSNLPSRSGTSSRRGAAGVSKSEETINYEITKVISHVVNPVGVIKRLTIAVLVDGTYEKSGETGEMLYKPRDEEELKNYEIIVKRAIGFSAERGDEVKVVNMPFKSGPVDEIIAPEKDYIALAVKAVKYLAPLLALLLLFFLVLRPLLKVLSAPHRGRQRQLSLPRTVAEIEQSMELPRRAADESAIEWAKGNPKDAANIIKGWIERER